MLVEAGLHGLFQRRAHAFTRHIRHGGAAQRRGYAWYGGFCGPPGFLPEARLGSAHRRVMGGSFLIAKKKAQIILDFSLPQKGRALGCTL